MKDFNTKYNLRKMYNNSKQSKLDNKNNIVKNLKQMMTFVFYIIDNTNNNFYSLYILGLFSKQI